MLLARMIVAVIFALATTQVVHACSLRGETPTTTHRSLLGRGKKRDDTILEDTNESPCDQYDDGHAVRLCKAYCNSDCNTMTMEKLAVQHDSVSDDTAHISTKRASKSKKSQSSSDDGQMSWDNGSCTELQSAFQAIAGEDVPCLRCPCWTKKTLLDTFADSNLITEDSCYDYILGEDSQIYLSDNVSFALAQDDLNGLFGNSTHYCLTDTVGPMSIDEKAARICVETLASYCVVIGKTVVEYDLPPV